MNRSERAAAYVMPDLIGVNGARAAEILREGPGLSLVEPHQRRLQHEAALHADIERDLHGLDGVVLRVEHPPRNRYR